MDASRLKTISGRITEITEADKGTTVRVLFAGTPLPAIGDDQVLFLAAGRILPLDEPYFVPIGVYQGILTVTAGIAERYVPSDSPLQTLEQPLETLEAELS